MKVKNKETGITLIALVITIIVLLILAGVALATLTGDSSIIGNAEKAVGEYNNKVKEEQEILNTIEQSLQNHIGTTGGGTTIIDSTEIASNPSEYYGGVVSNYTTQSGDPNINWKIFYADSSNIYLIADDYIHGDYAPNGRGGSAMTSNYGLSFSSVYNDYTGSADILNTSITDSRVQKWISYVGDNTESTNNNIKAVAYMLDTNIWSVYKNSTYADYAIGGPTLDLFVASYNQKHPDLNIGYSHDSTGYKVGTGGASSSYSISGLDTTDSTYVISTTDKTYAMWLAAPSTYSSDHVMYVTNEGNIDIYFYDYGYQGFRPIVCLTSGVQLEKQQNGTYIIK